MQPIDIVVVGSSNTDMVIRLAHLPLPGETEIGGEFSEAAGGKGANQAVGAARAGGHVALVACVGRDVFGDQALAGFAKDGINTDHVVRHPVAKSGVALIFVDADSGENCIAVASGANAKLSIADVHQARDVIAQARTVILQLEIPLATVEDAVTLAAKAGVRVILNPAPAQHLPDSLLSQVSVFTPNEIEAEFYSGVTVNTVSDAEKAAKKLLSRGIGTVIITLGARGSFVATNTAARLVPGFKITPLDTTGAGDIYNGALAVALGEGKSVFEAAIFANAAGAIAATRAGAQPSAPDRADIDALIATGTVNASPPPNAQAAE
ncbi:ribokinase [Lichenicola sp.]|uniref:ribokinase n=1 Tax=Lichenicola sp. TaxID=2804529 RepID=UPI003AFFAB95